MSQTKEIKIPKKKEQILDTAEDLFQRFGIKRITIEEICQTANVSKMTFYKYFKNKNELVKYLWNYWYDDGYAKFDEIKAMDIPFTEKIRLMLKLKEESVSKISYDFIKDYFNSAPEMQEFYEALYQEGIKRFIDFIKEGQEKGEVRPEMRPDFFIAVIGKLKELINDEKLVNSYPAYIDFVMELNNFIYYGILPRPLSGDE